MQKGFGQPEPFPTCCSGRRVTAMFHRTQLLLDRADAYKMAGQWQSAVELCEAIFETSWRSGQIGDLLETLLRLGLLYSTRSDRDLSDDYFRLTLTIAENVKDSNRAARALNGLGITCHKVGQIDQAEAYYSRAKPLAESSGDRRTCGDLELNLGIIANIRGDLEVALSHYENALFEYETIGHQQRTARVLNNLGMLHTDRSDYVSAAASLDRALHICRLISDVQVEGIVLTNKIELLLALGDLDGARTTCDDAFEISSRLDNGQLKADVLKSYGVIYRTTGKPHLAESHLRQAISLASELGHPLIAADAHRELALVLREEDRNKEALEALNRAHTLFEVLQARQEQADIDRRLSQLQEDFLSLVAKWGESIEAKDRYTSGHCQRVAEYACRIAQIANLSRKDLVWFRMGAFLHDVGKTEVPEEILNKPGRLTDEERAIMENHTVVGDEMLSSIEFPWDIRPMVRSHHERWDGKGYPDGLGGEGIPFTARILRIADVFDALTTTRSYRDPLAPEDALKLMEQDIEAYDPDLFDIFRDHLYDLWNSTKNLDEFRRTEAK
jgi:putative nucleotidyltransferase with HDIG domain